MALINVVRDPQIKLRPIIHDLKSTDKSETGDNEDNGQDLMQTKVFGILCPIITLNSIAVDFGDVDEFRLDNTGNVPTCKVIFRDRAGIFNRYVRAGVDNELHIQILPPVENTYKKIDLIFYGSKLDVEGDWVTVEGRYKLPDLYKSRFKALGKKTTYELCDFISTETGLGFATNVEATEDSRYIECRHQSYNELMSAEIRKSLSDETHVYDWWVDLYNYFILCDLYDRTNNMDPEEDMQVWVTENIESANVHDEPMPIKSTAVISNHYTLEYSDLHAIGYDIVNNPPAWRGTARAISVYDESKKEYVDHYVADGDVKRDEIETFDYAGEIYGDYNYLFAEECRDVYINKVKSEIVIVTLDHPQLGLQRGDQCRFVWYDNDEGRQAIQDKYEEEGIISKQQEIISNTPQLDWLTEYIPGRQDTNNPMTINLQVSGQYTVIGQYIYFSGDKWEYELHLSRPATMKPEIIDPDDDESNTQTDA